MGAPRPGTGGTTRDVSLPGAEGERLERAGTRSRYGSWSTWALVAVTVAGGTAVTLAAVFSPFVAFGYLSPSVHLVLETVNACVALLAAYLVYGRYVRRRQTQDLLLAQVLILLAVAGFGIRYVVDSLLGFPENTVDVWLPLAVRVCAAVLLVVAAASGGRQHRHLWPPPLVALVPPVVLVLVLLLTLGSFAEQLPVAIDPDLEIVSSQQPLVVGHPVLLLGQGASAVMFAAAAIAFAMQGTRRNDALLRWLAPACVLGAFARVHYVLFPSLYTDWLYTGDFFRTGFYFLLLIGAAQEIGQYWRRQARGAVADDRRRIARELHDGVIQELALIRSESHEIPASIPSGGRILRACDRALDEARAALQALGRTAEESVGIALHRAMSELSRRYAIDLEIDVDESVIADADQQHALLRIAREATSNAVRHGAAKRVTVTLTKRADSRMLMIQDDGSGFDASAAMAAEHGYGLISMRDRARALPGSFNVESKPGMGTTVTVEW